MAVKYRAENETAKSSQVISALPVNVISKLAGAIKHFTAASYGPESLFSRSD